MIESENLRLTPGRAGFERTVMSKDIFLQDGRVLEFHTNNPIPHAHSAPHVHNVYNAALYLAHRGVVTLPEVPATTVAGGPLDTHCAVYVDKRIGRGTLMDLSYYWLRDHDTRFWPTSKAYNEQLIPREELSEILDRGIEETGIGAILEKMRAEDAARPRQVPDLDINAVMRNMRDQLR